MVEARKRSRLRRVVRVAGWVIVALLACLAGLRGLVSLGEQVPMIEESGREVVEGPLRQTPIVFAQTDFWFYPPKVDAELGFLRVPARRGHPADDSEDSIAIRFVRFPATNGATAGAPPIVYLAGGPGGSGVATASGDRFPFFMKLREAGDVIALDQRGTVGADPYPVCPGVLAYPFDRAVQGEDMAQAHEPVLRECWSHWPDGPHPGAFNTVESAADLDDLRIALGADKLNLVGISYGTHLALAYIRLYPDRVAHAVLAGVEGPDHTYKRPAVVDGAVREISRALEGEAGWSGFADDIETAIERLAREQPRVAIEHPATGEEVEVVLGPTDLKRAVYFGLESRDNFRTVASRVRRIAEGDDALLARFIVQIRTGGSPSVMPLSMDCASGVSPERRDLIAGEMPGALIGDVANLDLTTICPYWPIEDLGDAYRSRVESAVPVLAVSGTLDVRTPPSQAEEVLAGFRNGAHLQIVGGGHGDDLLISTRGVAGAMVRFFRTGQAGLDRIVLRPL